MRMTIVGSVALLTLVAACSPGPGDTFTKISETPNCTLYGNGETIYDSTVMITESKNGVQCAVAAD